MARRPTRKELTEALALAAKHREAAEGILRGQIKDEQRTRIAAQRGLVVYVRSLEQFDSWLLERPELRHALRPILQELGLWEISLGYDPDTDLRLSAVSPNRA